MESPPAAGQDLALVVLTSSALVVLVLVLLTVSFLYCQRFWKSQCQRVFLRSQALPGQRVVFQASAVPADFPSQEPLSSPCCLGPRSSSPSCRPLQGPAEAVPFIAETDVPGLRLPAPQPDRGLSGLIKISPKAALAGGRLETRPLIRNSGCSDRSSGSSFFPECRQEPGGDLDRPAPLSSCATETPRHWPHAPVECTELDLQTFSARAELRATGHREDPGNEAAQAGVPGRRHPAPGTLPRRAAGSGQEPFPSFRTPAAESGELLGHGGKSLLAEITQG